MTFVPYDRAAAYTYARTWAFRRNPKYYNFDELGGDCTNFASQVIYAGVGVMNFTPTFGWYYRNANDRSPSWTGVQYLYDFLVTNAGVGPFGALTDISGVQIGDIIQLGHGNDDFYHSPVVTGFKGDDVLLAAHTFDAFDRPLSSYSYQQIRCIHILGARKNP